MRKVCDNFDQRICQKDHLDIVRHRNSCSSVEQHLENLKVVPDGFDDDDEEEEEEEEREEKDDNEDGDDDGIDKICTDVLPGLGV